VGVYSKIVTHPVDLGHVCRGIRRRQYTSKRDVRLDMWRVFANCVKFHSHPKNQEAVPSFVSIALHLREYFNVLWQEYMLPSDLPPHASDMTKLAFSRRSEDRKKRLENSGILILYKSFCLKTSAMLDRFLKDGGCVDKLDKEPIFSPEQLAGNKDLATVVENLKYLQQQLTEVPEDGDPYMIEGFAADLKDSYTGDLLEDNQALRNRIGNRLDRFFWKRLVPLHEANSRGVTQSSIWGNVAATIWARESSKKPYWPALCLGILAPEDQREGWHDAVTDRNEGRLPEKLASQLRTAKKRCEQAQKRQSFSYFLVEFLGTHEFIWVRETDVVEKFDPANDPNKDPPGTGPGTGKKKRVSRSGASVVGSKLYATALEECAWAREEYDNILQDAFDDDESDREDDDEEEGEMNYSFAVLALTDDEADDEDDHGFQYDEDAMGESDVEEANWLLSHDGMIDVASIGKKKTKKRVTSKKKPSDKDKRESIESAKKSKAEQLKRKKKASEEKKELKDLEKRRKKRTRDREKALKDEVRKQKRRRTSPIETEQSRLARDKRARATAIVKAYLTRTAKKDEEYKSLALNGVMQMPAAMVDPNGLLGMALAFRAAGGVLNMPDDSEEQVEKTSKPWTTIDTISGKKSAERSENLQKQIDLLEKEIARVRANTETRRRLAKDASMKRKSLDEEIETDDLAARVNHFKRKKKSVSKLGTSKSITKDAVQEDTDEPPAPKGDLNSEEEGEPLASRKGVHSEDEDEDEVPSDEDEDEDSVNNSSSHWRPDGEVATASKIAAKEKADESKNSASKPPLTGTSKEDEETGAADADDDEYYSSDESDRWPGEAHFGLP